MNDFPQPSENVASPGHEGRQNRSDWFRFLAAALIFNLCLAGFGRGGFGQLSTIFVLIYCGFIPFSIFCIFHGICRKLKFDRLERFFYHGLALFGLAFTGVFSIPLGWYFLANDLDEARRYCEKMIPAYEEFYRQNATHPATLDSLLPPTPMPRILQRRPDRPMSGVFYHPGNRILFKFYGPELIPVEYFLNYSHKRWYAIDHGNTDTPGKSVLQPWEYRGK